jgi:hypothetical protein
MLTIELHICYGFKNNDIVILRKVQHTLGNKQAHKRVHIENYHPSIDMLLSAAMSCIKTFSRF